MKLSGMLSKVMDNYVCLRGIAGIKALAEISEVNPDIQRNLLEVHKEEMKEFLEKGEYTFFPEVVFSMDLGLSDDDARFETFVGTVDSVGEGFNAKIGNVKINFVANKNKLIDDRKQLKVAQFTFEDDVRLSRIDGNHRLSAAPNLTNDVLIPFCIIVFPNEADARNNSRAIFHNINSKQIPLELEQNIRIIIESDEVFTDSTLEKSQPFGPHYKFTRELLCGTNKIDFNCFPIIKDLLSETKYSFFTDLFRHLLGKELINQETAVEEVKSDLVNIENALSEAEIQTSAPNNAIVGALAYYKKSDLDKYSRFLKWITKNHIADAKNVRIDDVISIFDKVYENISKKVFLARWYPEATNAEHTNAEHRLNAIKAVVEDLNLELVDIGTRQTGTFDIRSVMYDEISKSDIFIADLSGSRHNVMVEVGYALKHVGEGRMVFYFQKNVGKDDSVPFDLNGYMYDEIQDSAEIVQKVKPRIESILEKTAIGEL